MSAKDLIGKGGICMIWFNVCPVTTFQAVEQELVHIILASIPRHIEGAFSRHSLSPSSGGQATIPASLSSMHSLLIQPRHRGC